MKGGKLLAFLCYKLVMEPTIFYENSPLVQTKPVANHYNLKWTYRLSNSKVQSVLPFNEGQREEKIKIKPLNQKLEYLNVNLKCSQPFDLGILGQCIKKKMQINTGYS